MQQFVAHAVHRGGDDTHRSDRCVVGRERRAGAATDVLVEQRRVEANDSARVPGPRRVAVLGGATDGGSDLTVDGRHDLRAVAPIHLDAVVRWWVVACRHHHAGHPAESADRPRDDGRGGRLVHQRGRNARPGEDVHDVAGERRRAVTRVVSHDHRAGRAGRGVAVVAADHLGQPGGGLPGDQAVQPVGARPDRPAQPRGAERDPAAEQRRELSRISSLDRGVGAVAGLGVRVGVAPPTSGIDEPLQLLRRGGIVGHPRNPRNGRSGRCSQLSSG